MDHAEPAIVVAVDNVSKDFLLPHERASSTKTLFTHMFNSKAFNLTERQHALEDITFDVRQGEFFGIVGRNGSGKSTMLKLLADIYQPTTGTIRTTGKLVPFIELGVGFNGELTGRENVFLNGALLGFSRRQTASHYRQIVEFAELERFMDQKLKNYSSGMKVRLAFACATMSQPDILLVDEVLAVGDADFQRKCYQYFKSLKKNKTTVIFVTHDMNAVREFCDQAALIDKSRLVTIGPAVEIAADYMHLFTEDEPGTTTLKAKSKVVPRKRWGTGAVIVEDVTVDQPRPTDRTKQIEISMVLKGVKPYDGGLVSGFLVRDAAGEALVGSNTQVEQAALPRLARGDRCKLVWTCPNLFGDGQYTIDLAVHNSDGVTIYDWLEAVVGFYEKREKKTGYRIMPPVGVRITDATSGRRQIQKRIRKVA